MAVLMSLVTLSLMLGCATAPKPLKDTYFKEAHEMTVEVVGISEKPTLMDSGGGGIIGLLVSAGRSSTMREKMAGLSGDAVSELLRQTITEKLEDHFEVVEEEGDLATEITITNWGWFVPTTMFGIKTGSYQFRIMGSVNIWDKSKKGQKENKKPNNRIASKNRFICLKTF